MLKKEIDDLFKKLGKNKNKVAILNKIVKYASDNNSNYKEVILALQDAKNVNLFKQAQAMELEQSGGVKVYTDAELEAKQKKQEAKQKKQEATDLNTLKDIDKLLNTNKSITQSVKNMFSSTETKSNSIMNIMKNNINNIDIQKFGCKLLVHIVNYSNLSDIIVQSIIETIVNTMGKHINVFEIQESGCTILYIIIKRFGNNSTKVAAAGGIEAVMNAMKRWPDKVELQKKGLNILYIITLESDANKKKVEEANGIEIIVSAMKRIHNTHYKLFGLKTLINIAADKKKIINYIYKNISTSKPLIDLDHSSYIDELFSNNIIIEYLNSDDKGTVIFGLDIIKDFFIKKQSIFIGTLLSNDIERTVINTVMKNYLNNEDIQTKCIMILYELIDYSYSYNIKYSVMNKMVNANYIYAVIAAMKKHKEKESVQEQGCIALYKIITYHKYETDVTYTYDIDIMLEKNAINICDQDGIDAIIDAMNKYPDESNLQSKGSDVLLKILKLFTFSSNRELKEKKDQVIDEVIDKIINKGIERVFEAIKNNVNNRCWCDIIKIIAEKNNDNRKKIIDKGFYTNKFNEICNIESLEITKLINYDLKSSDYSAAFFDKLKIILVNDYLLNIFLENNGIEAVVAAMKANLQNAAFQESGCRALRNIAFLADNRQKVAAAGGIEAVVAAMQAHAGVAAVQEQGCWALCNIAVLADNQPKVAAAGGSEAVVAAMNAHTGVAAVQQYGCAALCNIALLDDNQPKVAAAGGIEAVVAAMNAHLNNGNIQEYGCGALTYIAKYIDIIRLIERSGNSRRIIDNCPKLERKIKLLMIEQRINFINDNKNTLSCEELLDGIRYFDNLSYQNGRTVTQCGHVFHKVCLDTWKTRTSTCPMCRNVLTRGGGNEECPICLQEIEINQDIFKIISPSYGVFIEILERCNDDNIVELRRRIEKYNPNPETQAGPSTEGGKKKQLKSKSKSKKKKMKNE